MTQKLLVLIFTALFAGSALASASGPQINLFPQSVIGEFQSSVEATKSLEESLEPIVSQMELSKEQLSVSGCDNTSQDSGCIQHRQALQQQFIDMLDEFEQRLPEVEKSLKSTNKSLGTSITKNFSRFTPRQLQKEVLQGVETTKDKVMERVRSQRPRYLSQRFKQYLQLVQTQGSSASLATTASEMYLETGDSLNYIRSIREQISHAKVQAQLDQQMGLLSDDITSTVSWAKNFIFGEFLEADQVIPDDSPLAGSHQAAEDYSMIEM